MTRQLFEEVHTSQENIDHYVSALGNTFKQFPPYVDQILLKYPFNTTQISAVDTLYATDIQDIDAQILQLRQSYDSVSDVEKKEIRKKIKQLQQQREERNWKAYIAFLATKDAQLAQIFAQLVATKFDFSLLSAEQQQQLVDTLVKGTLEDTIKNKIPELLSVSEEDITQFVHDLFDLKKMELTVPTKNGPIPLNFVKKEFLSIARKQLLGIQDLDGLGQLPLNFITQLDESNASFFEESPIFDSIYTKFSSQK